MVTKEGLIPALKDKVLAAAGATEELKVDATKIPISDVQAILEEGCAALQRSALTITTTRLDSAASSQRMLAAILAVSEPRNKLVSIGGIPARAIKDGKLVTLNLEGHDERGGIGGVGAQVSLPTRPLPTSHAVARVLSFAPRLP